jgi:hypothetical protein
MRFCYEEYEAEMEKITLKKMIVAQVDDDYTRRCARCFVEFDWRKGMYIIAGIFSDEKARPFCDACADECASPNLLRQLDDWRAR